MNALTIVTLLGYSVALTGVNAITRKKCKDGMVKNVHEKVAEIPAEECNDESIQKIIKSEKNKSILAESLITAVAGVALGAVATGIICADSFKGSNDSAEAEYDDAIIDVECEDGTQITYF